MKSSCLSAVIATLALPVLTACSAAGSSGGQSLEQVTATIEKAGFTCEVKGRHPKTATHVAQCRGNQDKYLILTVSKWKDPKARDQMYGVTIPGKCDTFHIKEQVRWSSLGNWLLVPGGNREKDAKALEDATAALGFESHAAVCK